MEACESGSMFDGLLPENIQIYATTASNATENSWATYCPRQFPSPPTGFDTCLGDLYSIAWMEDRQYFLYTLCLCNIIKLINLYISQSPTILNELVLCHDMQRQARFEQGNFEPTISCGTHPNYS